MQQKSGKLIKVFRSQFIADMQSCLQSLRIVEHLSKVSLNETLRIDSKLLQDRQRKYFLQF